MSKNYLRCSLILMTLLVYLPVVSLQAQSTDEKGWYKSDEIQGIDIGWIQELQFKEPAKIFAQHGWSYTAKQIDYARSMANWMQQTYKPKGLLGEMKMSLLAPPPSYPINSSSYNFNEAEKNNRNALPNTYGAMSKMYLFLRKTAQKKFWPIDGLADYYTWFIMANNVEMISKQMVGLSSTDEYYCMLPNYTIGTKGRYENENLERYANYRNFTGSRNLQPYEHYLIPPKIVDPGSAKYVVVMTRDKKPLPFDQVTIGELISRLETQLPIMYKIAINDGTKMQNLMENAKRGIQILKDNFKNQLNDFAYLTDFTYQIDVVGLANLEKGKEVYWLRSQPVSVVNNDYTSVYYPLFKLRKGVKEACAKGEPQWIICRLERGGRPDHEGEIHLMETFLERFNYAYLYNYFFGKDKVIEPYKPLVFADNKGAGAQIQVAQSAEAKKKSEDKSVLFFDDFSTVAISGTPPAWTTQRSEISGEPVTVTEVSEASGKWLKLKRNASPKNFPSQVTGNFEMSFDLLVRKGDVPWGTPGIDAQLLFSSAQGDKKITMNVSPGDMNRTDAAGWLILNIGSAACQVSSYYSLPDFTGSKPVNKVKMTFRKNGDGLIILSNNNKVYECSKALADGMTLKGLNFYVNEKNVFHVSNIEVRKL